MVTEMHSPPANSKRPRGILKNSHSYQNAPSDSITSPMLDASNADGNNNNAAVSPLMAPSDEAGPTANRRPSMHNRELSEREIVQMNTEINAGGPSARRASSNARVSMSRRQSSSSDAANNGTNPRLQWDEANLYLNEGQMGGKMKIDEPKTPFVHGTGDPMAEDEEESVGIDPNQLVVDELDKAKVLDGEAPTGTAAPPQQQKRARENDIPDLDLGEPEQDVQMMERRQSDGERKVSVAPVDPDAMDIEDTGRHGEGNEAEMDDEELKKHRQFEAMRKRHYEMGNVKDLLGHPEVEDDE